MKRRRRGPPGAAFFNLFDGNVMHMEAQRASATVDVDTTGVEEPSSYATGRVETLGETRIPSMALTDGYAEVALSTDSEPQGCHFEDIEFSSDEHSSAGEFTSRSSSYASDNCLAELVSPSGNTTSSGRPRTRSIRRRSGHRCGACRGCESCCCI